MIAAVYRHSKRHMQIPLGQAIEREICEQHGIPYLDLAPEERLRALLAHRNDRRLYRRTCDETGEALISAYPVECGYRIVKSSIWWGDSWEALDYGFEPQIGESFFAQFAKLQRMVPREGTTVINAENCEYNSHVRESKNCYLCSLAFLSEGLLYCYWSVKSRDVLDGFYCSDCELCARCRYVTQCYQCVELYDSSNCSECYFSSELHGCTHCLCCTNLSNKKYQIRNQACSPEDFAREVSQVLNGERERYHHAVSELTQARAQAPRRAQHSLRCEDVIGDHLFNSKRAYHCFDLRDGEACYNNTNGGGFSVAHGYSVGFPISDHVFSSVTIRSSSEIFFCSNCWNSHALWYCDGCVNCKECFGCAGLKHKQFCFFNRQYTPDAYRTLVSRWRLRMLELGEWGLFFPIELSPYAYDESAAQDFFPLSPQEIRDRGWRVSPQKETAAHERMTPQKHTPGVRYCSSCGQAFKVVPREQSLSAQLGVPENQECPDCRLTVRFAERAPYQLEERACARCGEKVLTPLSAAAAPVLWCEPCFVEGRA